MRTELLGTKDCIINITFEELSNEGYVGVTDYCRFLVENFGYQTGTLENCKIHVYRGEMLCLIVNDVKKAATIMAKDCKWTKFDKTHRKAFREPRGCV